MNDEEILKKHQKVLELLNEGKVQEGFSCLVSSPHLSFGIHGNHSENVNIAQEKIIEALVRQVSKENYREIFVILVRLVSLFGLSQRLCLEIGLLNLTRKIDLDFQMEFLNNLPSEIQNDPVLQIIKAETLRLQGKPADACVIYNSLPSRQSWWPFDALWETLTEGLTKHLLETNTKFLQKQVNSSTGWHMQPHALNELISGLLRPTSGNANDFRHQIEKIMWHTPVPNTDVGGMMIFFLASHIKDLDADRAAIVFHMAVSFEKRREIDLILSQESFVVSKLVYHPLFIKYFDIFSQKNIEYRAKFESLLDIFLKSSFSKNFLEGDMSSFDFSCLFNINVWATEVFSRYRKDIPSQGIKGVPFLRQTDHSLFPKTGGEDHLFIGVFGQMRDPRGSFSKVMEYLYEDTKNWRDSGKKISIAISTWDQTGQKKIEDGSPVNEFLHRLPEPVRSILSNNNIQTLAELRNVLPHTAEAIQKASYSGETVTLELINEIAQQCGFDSADIFVNISTENQYVDDIGREFREAYKNAGSGVENQARMWHRINGLYNLARQATERKCMPIGVMALIRPDVLFEHSSIVDLAQTIASETQYSTATCDFDPQACWIEGVGDRYFAGCAQAVARTFDAKDLILQIIRDPALFKLYQDRPFWHRFAQTIFYESDIFLKNSSNIHMQFLRQNISFEVLKKDLMNDYENIQVDAIKNTIKDSL